MKKRHALIVLFAALTLQSCAKPEIVIENAWIRTPPPGSNMTAGYLELNNDSNETVTLVGVTSAAFGSVTLHESKIIDGVWKMEGLPSLSIAAGEQISLQPGGLHLMMMEPLQPVTRGQLTTIGLEFADGKQLTIPAIVDDLAP